MTANGSFKGEEKTFKNLIARLMSRWGFNYSEALVYSTLLLSTNPLTIDEISSQTGLSKSSVSSILKKLSREYAVLSTRRGRTKYFSPRLILAEKFLEQPKEMNEHEVRPLKKTISKMLNSLQDGKMRERLRGILEELTRLECILSEVSKLEESLKCRE